MKPSVGMFVLKVFNFKDKKTGKREQTSLSVDSNSIAEYDDELGLVSVLERRKNSGFGYRSNLAVRTYMSRAGTVRIEIRTESKRRSYRMLPNGTLVRFRRGQ